MLKAHTAACVQGKRVPCSDCDWSFPSRQGMRQHFRVMHGAEALERDESFLCPHCAKVFAVKESMWEHSGVCAGNPDRKGPFYCRVLGCPSSEHLFSRMKNLNVHLSVVHRWAEHWAWWLGCFMGGGQVTGGVAIRGSCVYMYLVTGRFAISCSLLWWSIGWSPCNIIYVLLVTLAVALLPLFNDSFWFLRRRLKSCKLIGKMDREAHV